MFSEYTKHDKLIIAILIFSTIYSLVQYIEPNFLYKPDGTLREFGVGYRKKTILPLWLFSFILGIFSYIIACYIKDPLFS